MAYSNWPCEQPGANGLNCPCEKCPVFAKCSVEANVGKPITIKKKEERNDKQNLPNA